MGRIVDAKDLRKMKFLPTKDSHTELEWNVVSFYSALCHGSKVDQNMLLRANSRVHPRANGITI